MADNYEKVTDEIIEALEKGVNPWSCRWDRNLGRVRNGSTDRPYNGLNILLLWLAMAKQGWSDPRFYTRNQVLKMHRFAKKGRRQVYKGKGDKPEWPIRKGSKMATIFFWKFNKREAKDADGNPILRPNGDPVIETIPFLRVHKVYNHQDINWDPRYEPEVPVRSDEDPNEKYVEAAELLAKTGAKVNHGGGRAFYRPGTDDIGMPNPEAFDSPEDYWSTMLHELTHWTGHRDRCGRDLEGRFGSESYAAEELVAEMGAAFLCDDLGIQGQLQHPEYINNWLKVLRGDKYAVFTAARLAQDAVTFIHTGRKPRKKGEGEDAEGPKDEPVAQAA